IDVFVRQESVQQSLDGRVGGPGIEQVGALHPHHLLVGERLAPAQFAQRGEPYGGKAPRLDRRHVPATALDAEDLDLLVQKVLHYGLDRSVAAAVQHQVRFAAQETRSINAQREVASDPGCGIVVDQPLGFHIRPQVMHLRCPLLPTNARQSMQCPNPRSKARRRSPLSSNADPRKASGGSLVRGLEDAVGLAAGFRYAAQSNRFAGRKSGGALRRKRLGLEVSPRAEGAQGAYPPPMPRLPIKAADHPVDHASPRAAQHLEHIGMRRARVVVKEFDPPIALAADFSSGLQNGLLQHLPASDRLDCADQAMAAISVTQPALTPLLPGYEHALHLP